MVIYTGKCLLIRFFFAPDLCGKCQKQAKSMEWFNNWCFQYVIKNTWMLFTCSSKWSIWTFQGGKCDFKSVGISLSCKLFHVIIEQYPFGSNKKPYFIHNWFEEERKHTHEKRSICLCSNSRDISYLKYSWITIFHIGRQDITAQNLNISRKR